MIIKFNMKKQLIILNKKIETLSIIAYKLNGNDIIYIIYIF